MTKVREYRSFPRSLVLPVLAFDCLAFVISELYFYRQAFDRFDESANSIRNAWSLDTLKEVVTSSFYLHVILTTAEFGIVVVVVCAFFAYPTAYLISRSRRWGTMILLVVVTTSFTSVIARALGLRILLGQDGPVNSALIDLHLVNSPIAFVNNFVGAVLGTIHAVLPFMILFLYPAIEACPAELESAAVGLGAGHWYTFRRVVFPQTVPALVGGGLLVFAVTVASFTTPILLGGARIPLLSVQIRQAISTTLNAPLAAALAIVLLVMVLLLGAAGAVVLRKRPTGVAA